jgi:MazG family protein
MEEFTKLTRLMEQLRGENGCPWDKKQSLGAFTTFLLEEAYEVIDAIDRLDYGGLKEELGDLLFHIVFMAQICKEEGRFGIVDVIGTAYDKMYRRHPHVFSGRCATENGVEDGTVEDEHTGDQTIEERWEYIKKQEKGDYSPVSAVPRILPALLRAYVVSKRAAKVGFDWEGIDDIYEKMYEEIGELREAERSGSKHAVEEEIGDLLFTIANISRTHGIDPERALRRAIDKFTRRFTYVERHTDTAARNLKAMDALWNEIKEKEKQEL